MVPFLDGSLQNHAQEVLHGSFVIGNKLFGDLIMLDEISCSGLLCSLQMMWFCSSERNLQHALGQFAAKCEAVIIRGSISKSAAMVLCQKTVDCSLWIWSDLLPRVK